MGLVHRLMKDSRRKLRFVNRFHGRVRSENLLCVSNPLYLLTFLGSKEGFRFLLKSGGGRWNRNGQTSKKTDQSRSCRGNGTTDPKKY